MCRPSRRHTGPRPPDVDTGKRSPPFSGRKYTSNRPDVFETYAIHLPSGENCAPPSYAAVLTNARSSLPPAVGTSMTSPLVVASIRVVSRIEPSGDTPFG